MSKKRAQPARPDRQANLSPEDQGHYEAFDRRLQLLRDRTAGVALGYQTGSYIHGHGGLGKTYAVVEELKRLRVPFKLTNSRLTGRGLADWLNLHPDEVHVLDDVEPIFRDPHAVGVLRGALWGQGRENRSGRQERWVTWKTHSDGLEFTFCGGIIMIGNRKPAEIAEVQALLTRIPAVEVRASDREVAAMMRRIAMEGYCDGVREMTPEECREVIEYVIAESLDLGRPLDLRLIRNSYADYLQWNECDSGCHWHDLVATRLRQRATSLGEIASVGVRAARKRRELEIARELAGLSRHERLPRWQSETGKSEKALYRRLKELAEMDSQFVEK